MKTGFTSISCSTCLFLTRSWDSRHQGFQLFIGKDPAAPRSEKASSKKRSLLVSKLEVGSLTGVGSGSSGQEGLPITQQIIVGSLPILIYIDHMVGPFQTCSAQSFLTALSQDAHGRAWGAISDYMAGNLQFFQGRAGEAESTILPSLAGWLQDSLSEIPDSCHDLLV